MIDELIVIFIIIVAGFYLTIIISDLLKSEKAEKLLYIAYGIFSFLVFTVWVSEYLF